MDENKGLHKLMSQVSSSELNKVGQQQQEVPHNGGKIGIGTNSTLQSQARGTEDAHCSIKKASINKLTVTGERCVGDWSSIFTWDPLKT